MISENAVSVVVPLFNGATWVERAIRSVLAQTHQRFEIIVIDDGSTDGGEGIVKSFADTRIRLHHQHNAGVSSARNRGVAESKTEFIAFLDSDDEWSKGHLAELLCLSTRWPDCDVFGTAYVIRTGEGSDRHILLRGFSDNPWEGRIDNYFELASRSDPPLWSSAVAVRKYAIEAIGGFPAGVGQGEDLLTWARLASKFRIAYCTVPSAVFWQPGFLSAPPTRRPEVPDRVGEQLALLEKEVVATVRPSLRRYRGMWHKMRGTMFLRLGERKFARAELSKSWRYAGPNIRLAGYLLLTWFPVQFAALMIRMVSRANRLRRTTIQLFRARAMRPVASA